MNKYQQYKLIAEQKFVEKNFTLEKISEEYNIPVKTLYSWKRKNNWSEKRHCEVKKQELCSSCYQTVENPMIYTCSANPGGIVSGRSNGNPGPIG